MSPLPHPFDTVRAPEEVWAYVQTLIQPGQEANFFHQVSHDYVLAIAQHYAAFTDPAPVCTVATVVATVLCPNLELVLQMLASDPRSASTAARLLKARQQRALSQVAAVIAYLQCPLGRLVPGTPAKRAVTAYLTRFQE